MYITATMSAAYLINERQLSPKVCSYQTTIASCFLCLNFDLNSSIHFQNTFSIVNLFFDSILPVSYTHLDKADKSESSEDEESNIEVNLLLQEELEM